MKILCVIDSLGSGGAQRQLVNLAIGFKEKGHEVSFLVYHPNDFYKKELEKADISIKYILERNYLKRLLKMRRYIRRGGFDAVLSFLEAASFISTVSGFPYRKWKLVVGERSANPNILKSFKLRFYRWFHLFADYVVANSNANLIMVKKINPLLSNRKCRVIYNIPSLPLLETYESQIEFDKTLITIAASYRKVKNLDGLIHAIILLPQKYKNRLKVNWYGDVLDKSYLDLMSKTISENSIEDIILLNPPEKNIHQKFIESDFVGLFSHFEGFPNVVSEAMILKKPVVVSRVSDVPLFIEENKNGYMCDSNDVSSIKTALIKAIDSSKSEKKKMGNTNYRVAIDKFNREAIISDYLKLFFI